MKLLIIVLALLLYGIFIMSLIATIIGSMLYRIKRIEGKIMAREVQTIIIKKSKAKDRDAAKKLVKKYEGKTSNIRETDNSYRFQQRPAGDFKQDSFKTEIREDGVLIVWGDLD